MDLHTWLDDPGSRGRTIWLAEQLGVTKGAVSQWRAEGVPMKHMERIAALIPEVTTAAMLAHALSCRTAAKLAA
jgi:hypothetical protein